MTSRGQTFDDGTDRNGTTVDTTNSGNGGNDAFNTVNSTSGTVTYDHTHVMHGTDALQLATAGVSVSVSCLYTGLGAATMYGRYYVYIPTASGFTNAAGFGLRFRAAGSQNGRFTLDATGHLQLRNNGNTVVATSTNALSLDTWYRIECQITQGASGSGSCDAYVGDSTTSAATIGATTSTFGTANIDEAGIGLFAAGTSLGPYWVDSVNVNDVGRPGPASLGIATRLNVRSTAVRRAANI